MLVYLVAEVIALSFACELPATYDHINGQCIDIVSIALLLVALLLTWQQLGFWYFDAAFGK